MAEYQIRYLNGFTGEVVSWRRLVATTDKEAISRAEIARRMAPMELWLGERKIKSWEAFPPVGYY
jgi:hypothetical protein